MSRKADCWDNAIAENFFRTLKVELIYRERFETIEQAKDDVLNILRYSITEKDYILLWDIKTPAEMESEFMNNQNSA